MLKEEYESIYMVLSPRKKRRLLLTIANITLMSLRAALVTIRKMTEPF